MRVPKLLPLALAALAACGAPKQYVSDEWNGMGGVTSPQSDAMYDYEMAESESARGRSSRAMSPAPMAAPVASMEMASADQSYRPEPAGGGDTLPPIEGERSLPMLIYTGYMTLAIYDVEQKQQEALGLIEGMGGWASNRTQYSITFRVPAQQFRSALEELSKIGDVIDLSWDAADITDQYTDLQIRLQNSRTMRDRLTELLSKAETVADAIAIEQQLERLTLDIERIEGQLRSFDDRMAYSTLTVSFSQQSMAEVPGEEYRLPFVWLNTLGLENLLNLN